MKHYEQNVLIPAAEEDVFAYVDDHASLSSHMNKSSWMMSGGKMETLIDDKGGKKIGSHIQMRGKVLGIEIYLDEVITHREVPKLKVWKTVGTPKLLVIGQYQMKAKVQPKDKGSLLQISIDYEFPSNHMLLGQLFSRFYAKWCVEQMLNSVSEHFS